MTIAIALHDPVKMTVNTFVSQGKLFACLHVVDDQGRHFDIYSECIEGLQSAADAFNAAMLAQSAPSLEAAE